MGRSVAPNLPVESDSDNDDAEHEDQCREIRGHSNAVYSKICQKSQTAIAMVAIQTDRIPIKPAIDFGF